MNLPCYRGYQYCMISFNKISTRILGRLISSFEDEVQEELCLISIGSWIGNKTNELGIIWMTLITVSLWDQVILRKQYYCDSKNCHQTWAKRRIRGTNSIYSNFKNTYNLMIVTIPQCQHGLCSLSFDRRLDANHLFETQCGQGLRSVYMGSRNSYRI